MQGKTNSIIATLISKAAMIDNKDEFRKKAKEYTLGEWKLMASGKTGGVGFLTGLIGGPMAIAGEAADIAYLGSMAGRVCFGVGHILNKPVNYEKDMEGILAVWSGVANGINEYEVKEHFKNKYKNYILENVKKIRSNDRNSTIFEKIKSFFVNSIEDNSTINKASNLYLNSIKIDNKMIISDNNANIREYMKVSIISGLKIAGKVKSKAVAKTTLKIGTKMLLKKMGVKVNTKLISKASSKLATKSATKISTKWIPIIGGITSSAINIWVLQGLANAAEEYYSHDYIILNNEISSESFNEAFNTIKEANNIYHDNI